MDTTISGTPAGSLPIPFTKEQLRQDIINVYLLQARTAYLVQDQHVAWPLAGLKFETETGRIWNPDLRPEDYGITYAAVRDSHLALALEQQYDYGFFGLNTCALEPLTYETMHTWVAALLMDLKGSQIVDEWEGYGVDIHSSVVRCLHTCELANARRMLEDKEPFSYFAALDGAGPKSHKSGTEVATSIDGLTIRQMALLSGVEEMTVRTAASREGPNKLPTFKDEQRRTLVRPEDARKWLQAKGRYMTIKSERPRIDLARARPVTLIAFNDLVVERIREITAEPVLRQRHWEDIKSVADQHGYQVDDALTSSMLTDETLMHAVAKLLDLHPTMFATRARQAALYEELLVLERQLESAAQEVKAAT